MARKGASKRGTAGAPISSGAVQEHNYTIPGLIAIVLVVLITGLFFAQPNIADRASMIDLPQKTTAGLAYGAAPSQTPTQACEVSSLCDGSRLVRQSKDCNHFIAYCSHGCDPQPSGARCL